jgi:hypothetical protein
MASAEVFEKITNKKTKSFFISQIKRIWRRNDNLGFPTKREAQKRRSQAIFRLERCIINQYLRPR